ncbi:MAG: hypothetical protein JRF33_22840 [Deltaproteobacteria bacterium]|nr:hypothetical protein [Deltaproteobacteria bacterium]
MTKLLKRGCLVALACLTAFAAVGCLDYDPVEKQAYEAPLLTGQSSAADFVDLRGNLDFGQSVTDTFSETKPLTGYVFDAVQGARVTVTLKVDNGEDPVLILYGPLSDNGIWGQATKLDDDGLDGLNSLISDLELTSAGRYLLAAATYSGNSGGGFELGLGCRGACSEPHCPDVLCDLYCPNGFMSDPDGCPVCICAESECVTDEDCLIFDWTDDVARCIDGRCIFENQNQECQGPEDCPEGYECAMACGCTVGPNGEEDCECFGECVYVGNPECVDGEECGTENGLPGICVEGRCLPFSMECSSDMECPEGFECVEICAGIPGCDPDDSDCRPCDPNTDPICNDVVCEHLCMPVAPPSCVDNSDCPEGFVCVMEWPGCEDGDPNCLPEGVGYCVPDQEPDCRTDDDCFFPGGMGVCLNGRCVFEEIRCDADNACPPDMICEMACWDCSPEDPNCEPGCEGVCVPHQQPQCFSDFDCMDESGSQVGRCVEGFCVFDPMHCVDNTDCPAGFMCELLECWDDCPTGAPDCCVGICVPDQVPECRVDEECMFDNGMTGRCINGRCVFDSCVCPDIWAPVCAEVCYPDQCEDPDQCTGACEIRTFANACEADCVGAFIIHWGTCEEPPQGCSNDADCPAGTYCESDSASGDVGVCLPLPAMECQADSDCPDGFRCEPGYCSDMPCHEGEPCPECWGQCVPNQAECVVTGCSGEICAPYPVNSTCVWLPEYECLQLSICGALTTSTGQTTCGWTQTPEYLECLSNVMNPDACNADMDCAPGELCTQGVCHPSDCICPEVYDPVCGADGQTYDNFCFLNCAGVPFQHEGSCERGPDQP